VSQRAAHFDSQVLDRLTSALAPHVGQAAACVVVAKAAEDSVDLYQFCMTVATHVPAERRPVFLRGMADLVDETPLSLETLARAAQGLAQHIGPLAQMLVERESRSARNAADLYSKLAKHVRDPDARKAFVATASR
jgi:hypothetical protein